MPEGSVSSSALGQDGETAIRSKKKLIEDGINGEELISQLTTNQLECAREAFTSFDVNGNGMVSTSELRQLLRTLCFNPTEEQAQNLINAYSVDGMSEIDFAEFLYILAPMLVKDDIEDELLEIVRCFDPGRVGAVELMEIREIMEQLTFIHKMPPEEIDRMLSFIDQDGDGLLSVSELKKAIAISQQ